ncbi:MAG: hypothetical protein LC744_02090 [Chloroflexi bacterium]|nr:hypothetical protein [Chloroflexota bacterium]
MTDEALASASVEALFTEAGAMLDGHFALKSGRHAGRYLEKFLVLQHPRFGVEICRRLAVALAPYSPTVVVGAEPVAAAVIVDRSGGLFDLGLPLHALGSVDVPSWELGECELCAVGVPLRKPGSS